MPVLLDAKVMGYFFHHVLPDYEQQPSGGAADQYNKALTNYSFSALASLTSYAYFCNTDV